MNRQYNKMNYQYSRDLPANGNGNRMERASNSAPSQNTSSSFNRSRNGPSTVNQSPRPPIKTNWPAEYTPWIRGVDPPALGQPGALDDPMRKGLSGAGTRWYWRFLAEGWAPEIAREKAEKHRRGGPKTDSEPPVKRSKLTWSDKLLKKVNDPTKPNNLTSAKNPTQSTKPSERGGPVLVAVLPKDYPRNTLQKEEMVQVEEAIIDEIAAGHDKTLQFTGVEHRADMLVIHCKDWAPTSWLKERVPKLSAWGGVPLTTCLVARVLEARKIKVHLPRSLDTTHEKLLAVLKAQNEGLNVECWSIQSATEENDGQTFVVTIDGASYKSIAEKNHLLFYRFGTVTVERVDEEKKESTDDPPVNVEQKDDVEEGDNLEGDVVEGDDLEDDEGDEVDGDTVELVEDEEDAA